MQLHQLKPIHKSRKGRRVGRGGKRGTYSGRGNKGQRARAGGKFKPIVRELIKRYPKLRGYRFNPLELKPAIINVETLEKKFSLADGRSEIIINPEVLLEKGLVRRIKGKTPQVKILGKGKITKVLAVEGCRVSKQAREKIEKASGRVKV